MVKPNQPIKSNTMKTKGFFSLWIFAVAIGVLATLGCGDDGRANKQDNIKIGIVVPLSGNASVLGSHSKQGAELAIEEINRKGGLLGKLITVEVQDSKAQPKEGVNIVKNMVSEEQKPQIIYCVISGVAMAIRSTTEENKMILLAAVGTDKFISGSEYTVRNYIPAAIIGNSIALYVKDSMKSKSLGIFHANTEYSLSVKNALVKKVEELGLDMKFTRIYDETKHDYKSLVSGYVNQNVDVIFVDGIGTGLGTMIRQIREMGYKGRIISTLLVKDPDVKTAAGNALQDIYYLDFAYDQNSDNPRVQKFTELYKQKYNQEPTIWAVIAYDGMKLLLDKINEKQSLNNDTIIKSILNVSEYSGLFAPIAIKNREFEFSLKIKKME